MLPIHKNQVKLHHYFINVVTVIVLLFFCLKVSGQPAKVSKEEYTIYSSILNAANKSIILNRKREIPGDGKGMDTIVILNTTSCPVKPNDWEHADCDETQHWRNIKSLFDAMLANNQRSYSLRDHFSLTSRYEVISEKKLERFFQSTSLWIGYDNFHKKYGTRSAFYRFSRAGFNKRKTKALIYVFEESTAISAFGRFIELNKKRGKWKVIAEFGC